MPGSGRENVVEFNLAALQTSVLPVIYFSGTHIALGEIWAEHTASYSSVCTVDVGQKRDQ